MAKLKRRRPRPPRPKRPRVEGIHIGPHRFPAHWQPLDWLVPFVEGEMLINHSHPDPDDHSMCGPLLFCCLLAVEKYLGLATEPLPPLDWQLQSAAKMTSYFLSDEMFFYFTFCDPIRPEGLYALGLNGQIRQEILYKQHPLASLLNWSQINRLA